MPVKHKNKPHLWKVWKGIKKRCYQVNRHEYKHYGAKGVAMCDEWKGSYVAFREWALVNGYDEALTIDRKDADKGYSPENCRWITFMENAVNNRHNKPRLLTAWGETKTFKEWLADERCVVARETVRLRIKAGRTPEEAMSAKRLPL